MVVLGKLRLWRRKSNLQPPTGGGFGGRGTMGIIPMHCNYPLLPPRLADGFIDLIDQLSEGIRRTINSLRLAIQVLFNLTFMITVYHISYCDTYVPGYVHCFAKSRNSKPHFRHIFDPLTSPWYQSPWNLLRWTKQTTLRWTKMIWENHQWPPEWIEYQAAAILNFPMDTQREFEAS